MGQLLALKTLLISTGVLFMALGLRFSVPLVMEFLEYRIPLVFGFVRSWLRPPYLYLMINFIIISIAASSRFHNDHKQNSIDNLQTMPVPPLHDCKEKDVSSYGFHPPPVVAVQVQSELLTIKYQRHTTDEDEDNASEQELVKYVIGEDSDVCDMEVARSEYLALSPAEKSLVTARIGHQKPMKIHQGERAWRVRRPKQHDTMENTWKAIMEKKANSLNRHVTGHDTWENDVTLIPLEPHVTNETEKFEDRTNRATWRPSLRPSSSKLRKEPSLSQDELNRRAEEFIKKINEEMRLQRKESWEQYMQMINRGK